MLRSNVDNFVHQLLPVRGGAVFVLTCEARSETGDPSPLRLQMLWTDHDGHHLSPSITVVQPGATYRTFTATFTAPATASLGILYLLGHGTDWVRIDDVMLRQVN